MTTASIDKVRRCVLQVRPDTDPAMLADDTPLLESRVLTSLDLVTLVLELEQASGRTLRRHQLVPGSFRDLRAIADVFFAEIRR